MKRRLFITFFLLALFAFAQKSSNDKNKIENFLLNTNKSIAQWFDEVAESIDLYITGQQLKKEKNPSKLILENRTSSNEGQEIKNEIALNGILRLPNLEEYWQLKFSSYDETTERQIKDTAYLKKTSRKENYGATVGLFRKLGDVSLAFQPRIELKSPLKISHSLTLKSEAKLNRLTINPKLDFYATADKGTGIFSSLDFNYELTQKYRLNWINNSDYVSQTHIISFSNGLILNEAVDNKRSLSYGIMFFSNNKPLYYLNEFTIYSSYTQIIYKNIFRFELTPHLDFEKLQAFRGRAGLSLGLILEF